MNSIKRYGWNLLISIDQAANVVLGPLLNVVLRPKVATFGDPDETLSSVLGKGIQSGECRGCRLICRVLNWIDPGHCLASIEKDEGSNALK